ncbi:unnamed protein product, partial [Rotaria socialis]
VVEQIVDLRLAENKLMELSSQVTDVRSAVQSLQERQHERDAILLRSSITTTRYGRVR